MNSLDLAPIFLSCTGKEQYRTADLAAEVVGPDHGLAQSQPVHTLHGVNASAEPAATEAEREAVARIVDPQFGRRRRFGMTRSEKDCARHNDSTALRKADRILALPFLQDRAES
jgi:hypothetical protein